MLFSVFFLPQSSRIRIHIPQSVRRNRMSRHNPGQADASRGSCPLAVSCMNDFGCTIDSVVKQYKVSERESSYDSSGVILVESPPVYSLPLHMCEFA